MSVKGAFLSVQGVKVPLGAIQMFVRMFRGRVFFLGPIAIVPNQSEEINDVPSVCVCRSGHMWAPGRNVSSGKRRQSPIGRVDIDDAGLLESPLGGMEGNSLPVCVVMLFSV